MSSFKETLEQKTKEAEEIIKAYLPKEEGSQKTVMEAINYSVKVGGKRLRPILMREAFTELGGQGELIRPFMAAVINAGNLPLVWRNRESRRAIHGSNRDDTYLFPDP